MAINRDEQCTNNFGGVADLYIFKYVDYSRSKIKVTDNILTTFPYSVIYDLNALQVSFTESVSEEEGGVIFAQNGGFQLNKIFSTDNFKQFLEQDCRIIIKDNNDNYRLIGLETGLKIKYNKEVGTNLNDFSGFKFSFDTKEENTAPFITNLGGFSINTNPLWVVDSNFIIDTNDNKIEVVI